MKPITRSADDLAPHYDVVVVGSGYGGGVAATRFAQMGLRVAVLERGREFLPGDFPATPLQGAKEFQLDSRAGQLGSKRALFDMRVNADVSVLVGCGVGGTSLINGNVMLRPEPRVLAHTDWPDEIRGDIATTLAAGYQAAQSMINPVAYPGVPKLNKISTFAAQAQAIHAHCSYPPIAVTFNAREQPGERGIVQPPCTLCGDCCSGCNVGAKNTVAMNYLRVAVNAGAEVFHSTRVNWLEKSANQWKLVCQRTDQQDTDTEADNGMPVVTAERVVLGAGTLGSTEILLRSAERGLSVSTQVGRRFSGNADVIAFAYNNDMPVNGIGFGHPPVRENLPPVGPVIAGLIDLRDPSAPIADNMVIQEGALPSILAPLLPAMLSGASPLFGDDVDAGDFFQELSRSFKSLVAGAYTGAVNNTQTYLVMAHEGSNGLIRLHDDRLIVDWPDAGTLPVFEKISATLRQATEGTGGTYIKNPLWSKVLGNNLVSVHPLGGCSMGENAADGVVDHRCRVFSAAGQVHPGLFVMDGSVIPRSLGVNPSLTIAAVAERASALEIDA